MPQTKLDRFTASAATAFLAAVLCVFPLYIDRFSNLGLTKFTGVALLFLLFGALLGANAAVGAKGPAQRWQGAWKDGTATALVLVAATTVLSTVFSLSPASSVWGLGGYYGGLVLALLTAMGYCCVRTFARREDVDFLLFGIGVTSVVVVILYVLNIFNVDLIGAYENTAVTERAQFFSTLGQKNFNAGFFAISLPLVFYAFLNAEGPRRTALYAPAAVFGALALAVVDAEGLALGVGAALVVLVCSKSINTKKLGRLLLIGAAFFGWAALMYHMRRTVYTQGGTAILAGFGRPQLALPCAAVCLLGWLAFLLWRRLHKPGACPVRIYHITRIAVAAGGIITVVLFLLANFWPAYPGLGRLDGILIFNDDWGTYRGTAWRIAAGTWADGSIFRKLFGFGPSTMHEAVTLWAGADLTARMKTFYAAHNEYLEQLLTTGLLGLAAWVWFVAAHLKRGFANWLRPGVAPVLLALCSYLAQAVVSIRVSMNFPLIMLLFGLLAALTAPEPAAQPAPPAPKPRPGKRPKKAPAPAAPPNPLLRYGGITAAAIGMMLLACVLSPVIFAFLY